MLTFLVTPRGRKGFSDGLGSSCNSEREFVSGPYEAGAARVDARQGRVRTPALQPARPGATRGARQNHDGNAVPCDAEARLTGILPCADRLQANRVACVR